MQAAFDTEAAKKFPGEADTSKLALPAAVLPDVLFKLRDEPPVGSKIFGLTKKNQKKFPKKFAENVAQSLSSINSRHGAIGCRVAGRARDAAWQLELCWCGVYSLRDFPCL